MQDEKFDAERKVREIREINKKLEERLVIATAAVEGDENIPMNGQNEPLTYELLKEQCTVAMRVCANRKNEIEKLKKMMERTNHENADYIKRMEAKVENDFKLMTKKYFQVKSKYLMAKEICEIRMKKLNEIRLKYGEPIPPTSKSYDNKQDQADSSDDDDNFEPPKFKFPVTGTSAQSVEAAYCINIPQMPKDFDPTQIVQDGFMKEPKKEPRN